MTLPPLVLFPGLGMNQRMFLPQRSLPCPIEVPPWLDVEAGESLADFARRMAATIRSPRPYFVGGVSFGGLVALEAATQVEPLGVLLLGSARSPREISPLARVAARLGALVPEALLAPALAFAPLGIRLVGNPDRAEREYLLSLLPDADLHQVHWGLRSIMQWPGVRGLRCPVYQIHGERDRLMPLDRTRPEAIIPKAGHVINVTHVERVNRFIVECMRE